jgi:BirA family transcriptional regulator, biotin operon repressor / biotin---[acetyl-CoA-carboxylase] ligase
LTVEPTIWRVEHFEEIDSTNTYLKGRAHEAEGLVAFADFQTAGRGRLDRSWEAEPRSSLLCSLLFRPALDPAQLQLVVAMVALSARSAIERLSGLRAGLKWPNDLVVGENKLAGLLAEVVSGGNELAIVVGIGVNLSYDGPPEVLATSVRAQTGLTITPRALLDILLEEIDNRRALLETESGRASLREEYVGALATIGQWVRVEQSDTETHGRALGVDAQGRLALEVNGDVVIFAVGDVVHVRTSEAPS